MRETKENEVALADAELWRKEQRRIRNFGMDWERRDRAARRSAGIEQKQTKTTKPETSFPSLPSVEVLPVSADEDEKDHRQDACSTDK